MRSDKEIVIEHIFDAPVRLVWKVWTTASSISKWWGPKGFKTKVIELDFRPGGKWKYIMTDEDGNEYPSVGVFQEIVKHEKITSSDIFVNELSAPADRTLPAPMLLTTLFTDHGERTKVTIVYTHTSVEERMKHEKLGVVTGWATSFEKLENLLNQQ